MEILALLQRLNDEGRSIVMVTHDESVARHASRVIQLQDGVIVKDLQVIAPVHAKDRLEPAANRRMVGAQPA
jgi:putative ABC transport system ATP-binding protein